MFKTEQSCIDYLIAIRWPHGFECPVCGSIRSWKKSNGRFECIDCHKETTVTNGTIFHKSTKSLLIWFNAIWWMVAQKNGVSAVVQHCLRNTHFVHNCTKKPSCTRKVMSLNQNKRATWQLVGSLQFIFLGNDLLPKCCHKKYS